MGGGRFSMWWKPISPDRAGNVSTGQGAWHQDTRIPVRDLPAGFSRGHFRFVRSGSIKLQLVSRASEIEKHKLQ